jgi:hypothetical protein
MKAVYVRFLFLAVAVLLVSVTTARAASPAPVYADVVITFGGQTFGFAGPLRYFAVSEDGGRIGFDLTSVGTPGYSPRPDIDATTLRALGNHWEVVTFAGRSPLTIAGTCAVESFAATENAVRVPHVFLKCADLDV